MTKVFTSTDFFSEENSVTLIETEKRRRIHTMMQSRHFFETEEGAEEELMTGKDKVMKAWNEERPRQG